MADGSCDPGAFAQALRAFRIAGTALADLGATLRDDLRTRMYLIDAADWEAVGRAHNAYFGPSGRPPQMVVVAGLLDPRWRVEVEVEAIAQAALIGGRELHSPGTPRSARGPCARSAGRSRPRGR